MDQNVMNLFIFLNNCKTTLQLGLSKIQILLCSDFQIMNKIQSNLFFLLQGVYYVFTHLEFWVVEKWLILQQTSVNTKCTLISQTPLLKISLRSSNHGLCYSCVGYQRSNSKFTHLHSYALTLARARFQPHKFDLIMIQIQARFSYQTREKF